MGGPGRCVGWRITQLGNGCQQGREEPRGKVQRPKTKELNGLKLYSQLMLLHVTFPFLPKSLCQSGLNPYSGKPQISSYDRDVG